MVTGYDHYVTVPLSVTMGDFKKPEKVMFYTARTADYDGRRVEGVDRTVEMDQAFLEALKPLGVEPGNSFDKRKVVDIDSKRFRAVAEKVREAKFVRAMDPAVTAEHGLSLFKTKGEIPQHLLLMQSVLGPIGLPATEALYPPVTTTDGQPMNAQNDYVIRITKDELPPAKAFWSLTLYDTANGFFIPNDSKKYSVGENSGMTFTADEGIYVAAEKPEGVPAENWLPTNRKDLNLDIILRIYVRDNDPDNLLACQSFKFK